MTNPTAKPRHTLENAERILEKGGAASEPVAVAMIEGFRAIVDEHEAVQERLRQLGDAQAEQARSDGAAGDKLTISTGRAVLAAVMIAVASTAGTFSVLKFAPRDAGEANEENLRALYSQFESLAQQQQTALASATEKMLAQGEAATATANLYKTNGVEVQLAANALTASAKELTEMVALLRREVTPTAPTEPTQVP